MSLRPDIKTFVLVLPLAALVSCANFSQTLSRAFSKQSVGLGQVDRVVQDVQAVHEAAAFAKESTHDSVEWLRAIVTNDFGGDAATAYNEFADAVALSEKHAEDLAARVETMKRSAGSFYESWADEQWNFTSAEMRNRSQKRMVDSRTRYDAILAAIEPAFTAYEAFNVSMHDISLFLGHDFNVANELQREVRALARQSTELESAFARTLEATDAYVQTTSLPMVRAEVTTEEAPAANNAAQRRNR